MNTDRYTRALLILVLALASLAPILAAERTDKIVIQGNPAGTQTVKAEAGGAVRVEYSYTDRGRGDHIVATWKLDSAGLPTEYEGKGNDYMKAAVEERFAVTGSAPTLQFRALPTRSALRRRSGSPFSTQMVWSRRRSA